MKKTLSKSEGETVSYGPNTARPVECTEECIRHRAYELYEARGRESGHDMDDWLQAERELKGHLGLAM